VPTLLLRLLHRPRHGRRDLPAGAHPGSGHRLPADLRRRDGQETLTEVLYNASLLRDTSGNVLGVFATARDVTKQMQAPKEIADQQAREQDRLAELERFKELVIGRELKMIELKKEIEYLRKSGQTSGTESEDQHWEVGLDAPRLVLPWAAETARAASMFYSGNQFFWRKLVWRGLSGWHQVRSAQPRCTRSARATLQDPSNSSSTSRSAMASPLFRCQVTAPRSSQRDPLRTTR
jgi:hypothetical protein